ncbi:MAG: hypothetical protein ACRD1T_05650, partial [Acidimicrobiia bacterium]
HKTMIEHVASEFSEARMLTSWPHTTQLRNPFLGYVRRPLRMKSFSLEVDLEKGDLILVSAPAAGRMDELRELAQQSEWRRIKRLKKGAIQIELFGRSERTLQGGIE